MTHLLPRVKGRVLFLVLWYTEDDTAIQARVFEDKDEASKLYDYLVKRGILHVGLRDVEVA